MDWKKEEGCFLDGFGTVHYGKNILERKRGLLMFLANLSHTLLRLCEVRQLSYADAAALCGLSTRYFGAIVCRRTGPTIRTLEKLCSGFGVTPNALLLAQNEQGQLAYRSPMCVIAVRSYRSYPADNGYPICPRCDASLDREYQQYCDRCGQCLDWSAFARDEILLAK